MMLFVLSWLKYNKIDMNVLKIKIETMIMMVMSGINLCVVIQFGL